MSKEYIPVATSETVCYEPQTQEEFDQLMEVAKVGDMVYNKWVFDGLWYTVGLNDINDPTTICLFPNIIMDEPLKPLRRWGMARMDYLKEQKPFVVAQFGTIGLHKHCLEIQEQAENRKHSMMTAIRKDPANRVTEKDKAQDPMAWVGCMKRYMKI